MEERKEARNMFLRWCEATSSQNTTRRILALTIAAMWCTTWAFAVITGVVAVWVPSLPELATTSEMLAGYADAMSTEVMLLMGYYFGAPQLDKFVDAYRQRKGIK